MDSYTKKILYAIIAVVGLLFYYVIITFILKTDYRLVLGPILFVAGITMTILIIYNHKKNIMNFEQQFFF